MRGRVSHKADHTAAFIAGHEYGGITSEMAHHVGRLFLTEIQGPSFLRVQRQPPEARPVRNFVSMFLACVLVWQVVPLDYRGGGGLIWLLISTLAMIFRFAISFVLGRITQGHEEQRGKDDLAALKNKRTLTRIRMGDVTK